MKNLLDLSEIALMNSNSFDTNANTNVFDKTTEYILSTERFQETHF